MGAKKRMQSQHPRSRPEITLPPQQVPLRAVTMSKDAVQVPASGEALALIQRLEELRDSRVITFFANPDVIVRGDVPLQVYEQLRRIGKVPRLDLFVHCTGGQTEVPWRMITLIRNFCQHFGVLVPYMAYSAATHLAMGADEIVMGPMSELSPVDPARSHPLLPKEREGGPSLTISVQDLRHCIEFLKREGGEYTPESLASIYVALFDKIHPLALGAIEQSYALGRLISEKVLSTHMNPETEGEQIKNITQTFSEKFFSHHYRIGWKEAKEIGLKVTYVDDELWEMMWKLYGHYDAYRAIAKPIGEQPSKVAKPIIWIDSNVQRRILEETYTISEEKERPGVRQLQPVGARWLALDWQSSLEEQQSPAATIAAGE